MESIPRESILEEGDSLEREHAREDIINRVDSFLNKFKEGARVYSMATVFSAAVALESTLAEDIRPGAKHDQVPQAEPSPYSQTLGDYRSRRLDISTEEMTNKLQKAKVLFLPTTGGGQKKMASEIDKQYAKEDLVEILDWMILSSKAGNIFDVEVIEQHRQIVIFLCETWDGNMDTLTALVKYIEWSFLHDLGGDYWSKNEKFFETMLRHLKMTDRDGKGREMLFTKFNGGGLFSSEAEKRLREQYLLPTSVQPDVER